MTEAHLPLVSCIMPTANRRQFVPQAIRYFLAQDYPNRELVVLDDGAEPVGDLMPDDPRIRYIRLSGQRTLGQKRNECVEASQGDLIMHWDDDDWMAPHRISYQVGALLQAGAEVCSLQNLLFYEPASGKSWLYKYPQSQKRWLAGGPLLYTRAFWKRSPFPAIQVGSDTRFVWSHNLDKAVVLPDYTFYVAMIHQANTSQKDRRGPYWTGWGGNMAKLLGPDLAFYQRQDGAKPLTPQDATLPVNDHKVNSVSLRKSINMNEQSKLPQYQKPTRIGYILLNFSPLSETFIRREIMGLCQAGHKVFVYTHYYTRDSLVKIPDEPNLTVRQVSFNYSSSALRKAVELDNIEHLHSSLMWLAHRATYEVASALQIPFTLTAYSGHDIFTARNTDFYYRVSRDSLCEGIIVEDDFMRDWLANRLQAEPAKLVTMANSFDTELYRRTQPYRPSDKVIILAIARFVEKKGLWYLVQAFNRLSASQSNLELWLAGNGPEESRLRQAAGSNAGIKFLGAVTEEETRRLYEQADIFCLPCVQTASGDADGIPTSILEAMAFEMPVVASNLLSACCYIENGKEGFLVQPGDVADLAQALGQLCQDSDLRIKLGLAGRTRVTELCDLKGNLRKLESLILQGRLRRWRAKLDALIQYRQTYSAEREAYYNECRRKAIEYFAPGGHILDLGCGQGKLRFHLPPGTGYTGCDPLPLSNAPDFNFVVAAGEALPFSEASFDGVIIYAVLPNVLSVEAVLKEACRVLKPGGRLYLQECVNDPNPIHLNHFTRESLGRLVSQHFEILDSRSAGQQLWWMKCRKPDSARLEVVAEKPLVSIALTTYNRAEYLPTAINSVLNQTYQPVEVVVVDDGSSDHTRQVLEHYGSRIKVAFNEQNRGIAYSKNLALRMTAESARFVGMLDSDDYFHPKFVERCAGLLEANPAAGLVYADDTLVDSAGRMLRHQPAVAPWSVEGWLRTCNLRGDTWLARRELVMQTRLHDESVLFDVDYDLFYQLLELTTFLHLPEYLVYIRQHSGQTTSRHLEELAKCHARNLVKYGYSPEYAYLRARHHPEWLAAIEEGILLGHKVRTKQLTG
ncbi:MAG TPA: glycosyltransferase [Chloroflexia bacterium]|nr:glycosyltransferase [Chloroflexia bacterium]